MKQYNISVDVFDPIADSINVVTEYGIELIKELTRTYDGIILAVSHDQFSGLQIEQLKSAKSSVIFDTKSFLDRDIVDSRL